MYVVFEGPDGCGKDSQLDLLTLFLHSRGTPVLNVAEPYMGHPTGELIRAILKEGSTLEALPGLFLANRTVLQSQVISPALQDRFWVLSSRSFLTTLAYQQDGWPLDWLIALHRELPVWPSVVILLDLDPKTAIERILVRGGAVEHFEKLATLTRNRERYKALLSETQILSEVFPAHVQLPRILTVDAALPKEEVHYQILKGLGLQ